MRKQVLTIAIVAALGGMACPSLAQAPVTAKPAATVKSATQSAATTAIQAKLAWRLLSGLPASEDAAVSTASLTSAFALVGEGASPKLQSAIARVLGFGDMKPEAAINALRAARQQLSSGDAAMFSTADQLVFSPSSPPGAKLRANLDRLKIPFVLEDITQADAASRIDAWVKKATRGAIPEILGGPLHKPGFVALNALHFKGKWKTAFDPAMTAEADFTRPDGSSSKVAMMKLPAAERAYRTEGDFVAVDLPFAGDRYSLIVVTSFDAPKELKDFDGVSCWLSGEGFAPRKGDLSLPRFSMSTRADLFPLVDQMGLHEALKPANALTGFGAGTRLSQILQQVTLDVYEEGAEAAAATAIAGTRSLEPDDTLHMRVDKPFLYVLRDRQTGLVMAAGHVAHPVNGKAAKE